jgi:hypothetical protein
VGSVNALIKAWCRAAGLKDNYVSHNRRRKTFGYYQRTCHLKISDDNVKKFSSMKFALGVWGMR